MELTLKVYDNKGNVVKESKAKTTKIKFGVVRAIAKLMKVDSVGDSAELVRTVTDTWDQLTGLLETCFPDISDDDWDNVDLEEVVLVLWMILKDLIVKILSIPKEKNVTRE